MSFEKEINKFFQLIAEVREEALLLQKPFYTRITLLALLDAVSRVANPTIKINRDRFIQLIGQYANWELSDCYSLRQLSILLSEPNAVALRPHIDGLINEINKRMQKFPPPASLVNANDIDPSASDLESLLTSAIKDFIEPVRYPHLLWTLRNFIIHELREPGRGIDFGLGKAFPYYHEIIVDSGERTWELFIPTEVFTTILTNAANNLQKHLIEIDRNPWAAFPYNSKWYS